MQCITVLLPLILHVSEYSLDNIHDFQQNMVPNQPVTMVIILCQISFCDCKLYIIVILKQFIQVAMQKILIYKYE